MSPMEEQLYWQKRDFIVELLEQLPSRIFWKNKDGVYMGCNQAFADSLGLTTIDDVIGKTDYDLPTTKEESDAYRADDKEVMERKKPKLNIEEQQTLPDGRKVILSTSKVPLLDHNGNVLGVLGIYHDITTLKNAQKQAEESNELKTQFIRNMQHDIRTPLSALLGYLQNEAEAETGPERKKDYLQLCSSIKQLVNMCNEMVDFENAAYMVEEIHVEPVETERFLMRSIDLNRVAARQRDLTLDLNIAPDFPSRLILDKKKVHRILVNLIGNALKFTDHGGVTLHAKLLSKNHQTATISFEVQDTGIGIPEDKFNLIFEKFVRLNPSNQAKYKGSGLGLYHVKKFVGEMDGKLEVESTYGKGSIFRVILTVEIPSDDVVIRYTADEDEYDTVQAIEDEIQKFPDARFKVVSSKESEDVTKNDNVAATDECGILLIEDDGMLQKLISGAFTRKGCKVSAIVDSVSKAINAVKKQKYQLVVCDLGILEGTGIDVMNWVKQDKSHPNQETPFIVLTANSDGDMRAKALGSGFIDVFYKPLTDSLITGIINNYIFKNATTAMLSEAGNKKEVTELIIDIDNTLAIIGNDVSMMKEVFGMLSKSIKDDKTSLEAFYAQNDIKQTREILHRLDGTLRSCVAPRLQRSRGELHDGVRNTAMLSDIRALYEDFYKELDVLLEEIENLKSKGIL